MATRQQRRPPLRPHVTTIVPTTLIPGRSSDVTVGAFIVEQINAGVDPINAAGTLGIDPSEFKAWMREGVLVRARLDAGADWRSDFTPAQQDLALFADETIRAHASHIARLSIVSEQIARGTLPPKITTRTKTVSGQVVESSETRETMLPDADMLRWKLEKLEPAIYGQRASLSITVTDLTDTASVADMLDTKLREVAAALRPRAIETTSSDSDG